LLRRFSWRAALEQCASRVGRDCAICIKVQSALSTAIVLDATVVRMVVVPATMALLGRANWWLPGWLDRRLPHVRIEDVDVLGQPERVLAGASGRG